MHGDGNVFSCLADMERYFRALRSMLPWLPAHLEERKAAMGADPWPYGVEANRATLEALTLYLYQQGLADKIMPLDKVFVKVPAGS